MQKILWVVYAIFFVCMIVIVTYNVNKVVDIVVNDILYGQTHKVCE